MTPASRGLAAVLVLAAVLSAAAALSPTPTPPLPPPPPPLPLPPVVGSGAFHTVNATGLPTARHEACAVMVAGKVYLIGGRGVKSVDVFDPATNSWTEKPTPGFELHHMQCVAYENRYIYMAGAWLGSFPNEVPHEFTFRYDTELDVWANETGLGARARGGGASAIYGGKLYLAMGNRGGHGAQATTLGEFDVYDPVTKTWAALADAPDGRDHVGGGIVGGRFCISGGRDGGVANFWSSPVTRINCYNFVTKQWERKVNMPYGRAGAATGATCQGLLMIAGGEGIPLNKPGKAFARVDFYDVFTDSFKEPVFLERGRHGTGLAIADCLCGNIYYPSGSGGLGGGPELTSMEVWTPDGAARIC